MNQQKPNPEAVAASAIEAARTTSVIETVRAKGGSDEDVVKAVFSDEGIRDLARSISILNLLVRMGWLMGIPRTVKASDHPSLMGYVLILRHFTDDPRAIAFEEVHNTAKTVRDVWDFFLQQTGYTQAQVTSRAGFDPVFFENQLNQPFPDYFDQFGINPETAIASEGDIAASTPDPKPQP